MNSLAWVALFFASVFALLVLPLAPAIGEWRRRRDAAPLRVVREYDVNVEHFADRFRHFVRRHFGKYLDGALPQRTAAGILDDGTRFQLVGADSGIALAGEDARESFADTLIVSKEALSLPADTLFEAEVYCLSDIRTGAASAFRALLSEGDIGLAEDNAILRWAHGNGEVAVGQRGQLYGRVSAGKRITLTRHCTFTRLHAPVVLIGAPSFPRPHTGTMTRLRRMPEPPRLLDTGAGRWLIGKSFAIPDRTFHRGDLIARGELETGTGCYLAGSLKSHGDMHIGPNVRVDGAVVSGRDIYIGAGCILRGPVVAEGKIVIAEGVRIGSCSAPATVTAPAIAIGDGCVVHGTVWARELGETTAAE